jgi:hypothetical protein
MDSFVLGHEERVVALIEDDVIAENRVLEEAVVPIKVLKHGIVVLHLFFDGFWGGAVINVIHLQYLLSSEKSDIPEISQHLTQRGELLRVLDFFNGAEFVSEHNQYIFSFLIESFQVEIGRPLFECEFDLFPNVLFSFRMFVFVEMGEKNVLVILCDSEAGPGVE